MFAPHLPRWTARLARAVALVKAFALLEDPPRSAQTSTGAPPARVSRRPGVHPHDRRLAARAHLRPRRPGSVAAKPAACTVPIGRRARVGRPDGVQDRVVGPA
jgi:hypothetical protein